MRRRLRAAGRYSVLIFDWRYAVSESSRTSSASADSERPTKTRATPSSIARRANSRPSPDDAPVMTIAGTTRPAFMIEALQPPDVRQMSCRSRLTAAFVQLLERRNERIRYLELSGNLKTDGLRQFAYEMIAVVCNRIPIRRFVCLGSAHRRKQLSILFGIQAATIARRHRQLKHVWVPLRVCRNRQNMSQCHNGIITHRMQVGKILPATHISVRNVTVAIGADLGDPEFDVISTAGCRRAMSLACGRLFG